MNESLFATDNNTRKKPMSRNNSPDRTVRLNTALNSALINKKAVLPQGNRAMPQVFFSVEVRQQLSLQV